MDFAEIHRLLVALSPAMDMSLARSCD